MVVMVVVAFTMCFKLWHLSLLHSLGSIATTRFRASHFLTPHPSRPGTHFLSCTPPQHLSNPSSSCPSFCQLCVRSHSSFLLSLGDGSTFSLVT
ncbi:hypothetical protein E2C01_034265 [Portunus trituberculatus]|uniref:Secreted protein n=1 Tax=Portunus trituberculatus TaxID=210409 RepID=A0A5B7F034_PORTR|nr:hypothetical protein [Portunus trituberculatus]